MKGKYIMNLFGKGRRAATKRTNVSIVLTCVLSVCCAVLLTAFNSSYLGENGLYKNSSPVILLVLLALISVGAAVFGAINMTAHANASDLPMYNSKALTFVSIVMIAEFVSIFALYFLLGPLDLQYGVGHGISNIPDLAEKMKIALLCYRLLIPLSLFASVYFVLAAMKKKIDPLFGSVTLVWLLIYILRLYFDVTDWVMSVRKLTVICAVCIFAMFLINEIRFAFGRASFRKYYFFASLGAIFCISSGFAGVCSIFINIYPLNYELGYYGAVLFMGLYALIRVLSFLPEKRSHREIYDAYASSDETDDSEGDR